MQSTSAEFDQMAAVDLDSSLLLLGGFSCCFQLWVLAPQVATNNLPPVTP